MHRCPVRSFTKVLLLYKWSMCSISFRWKNALRMVTSPALAWMNMTESGSASYVQNRNICNPLHIQPFSYCSIYISWHRHTLTKISSYTSNVNINIIATRFYKHMWSYVRAYIDPAACNGNGPICSSLHWLYCTCSSYIPLPDILHCICSSPYWQSICWQHPKAVAMVPCPPMYIAPAYTCGPTVFPLNCISWSSTLSKILDRHSIQVRCQLMWLAHSFCILINSGSLFIQKSCVTKVFTPRIFRTG